MGKYFYLQGCGTELVRKSAIGACAMKKKENGKLTMISKKSDRACVLFVQYTRPVCEF